MGIERVDQDQRPLVADADALAVAAVRQVGVVAHEVAPWDFDGVVVERGQQDLAVFTPTQLLDQVAQRNAPPAVLARQAERRWERGNNLFGRQPGQALEVADLGGAALWGVQLQHTAAVGAGAHRARVCPLRAAEGHQGNQGSACAGQDGSGSEHHHNFHVFRFRRCKEPGLVRVFHRSPGLGAGGGHRVTMQGKARNPTGPKRKIATNRAS